MRKPKKSIGCRVEYTITVDHPEKRGPSFHPVPAGHRIRQEQFSVDCASAARRAAGLANGSDDFPSEYVSKIRVLRIWAEQRSPGIVRKEITRTRRSDGSVSGLRRRK